MESNKIKVQATISKPASEVWAFYTQPEHIVNWKSASDDWHCPSATNEMRIGGRYFARMEAKDGSFGFDFEAIYSTINEGQSFAYEMPDGRMVAVDFQDQGNTTQITLVFDAESQNPIKRQRDGWQAILNNFKKYADLREL